MAVVVRELITKLLIRGDTRGVRKWDNQVNQLKGSMGGAAGSASKLGTALKAAVGAAVGLEGLRRGVMAIVNANAEYERLRANLVTVTGSQAEANKEWERLLKLTEQTPFQIKNITQAYTLLKVRGFDTSNKSLKALGDTAAAFTADITEVQGALSALARGEADPIERFGIEAKFSGERVQLAFGDMKRTVKRDIGEFQKFFNEVATQNFAGAMERQMDTIGGRVSNLKDQWFKFAIAIGDAGLREAVNELLAEVLDLSSESGSLATVIGQRLAGAIRVVTRSIRWLRRRSEGLKKIWTVVVEVAKALAARQLALKILGLGASFSKLAVLMTPAAVKFGLIAAAILLLEDLIVFMRGGDSMIGRALGDGAEADRLRESLGEVVEGVKKIGAVFSEALGPVVDFFKELDAATIVAAVFYGIAESIRFVLVFFEMLGTKAAEVYLLLQEGIQGLIQKWTEARDAVASYMAKVAEATGVDDVLGLKGGTNTFGEGLFGGLEEGRRQLKEERNLKIVNRKRKAAGLAPLVRTAEGLRESEPGTAGGGGTTRIENKTDVSVTINGNARERDVERGVNKGLKKRDRERELRQAQRASGR